MDPFVIYAHCRITYDGRATSTLDWGNYLIMYKQDGCLSIHGGSKTVPRNYQGAGSTLAINNNKIVSINKKERIEIEIDEIIWRHDILDWSLEDTKVCKTEKELVDKIVGNPGIYLGFTPDRIEIEYSTEAGPIDIMAWHDGLHAIEVKRKRITLNNCVQLRKYIEHVRARCTAYIAGPDIAPNALEYCKNHNFTWMKVTFDG